MKPSMPRLFPRRSIAGRSAATVLWIAALSLLAGNGAAQQFPSQQRGLSADTAYQLGVIDNVNLFNGGLTLQIPIGPTYPVGPTLSFSLTLTYSSVGWDYEEDVQCFDPDNGTQTYDLPIESPHSNAGFGWRIVLGKVVDAETITGALKYVVDRRVAQRVGHRRGVEARPSGNSIRRQSAEPPGAAVHTPALDG